MARHLAQRGHHVKVLTTDACDAHHRFSQRDALLDGVHVRRDPNLSNRWAWNHKVFLPLGFGSNLSRQLRLTDVIHLFDFRTMQNAVVLQMLHSRNAPRYVLSAFGELPRATGIKRPIKQVYDLLFGFRLLRSAAIVLAQTPEEADEYRRFGCRPDSIRQLPLAVDLEEERETTAPGTFRRCWGFGSENRIVLFLGRIHEYKGLDVLIKAFSKVTSRRPDVRLVIAGRDDGYLARARGLAETLALDRHVLFPGPIYGPERFAAYRDADIFAMTPTHAEQTSLAALEACAVGTPVVLSEQAPIPWIDAVDGGVVVPSSPEGVAAALARVLDRADRRGMGQRAQHLIAQRHSWATVTEMLESIYQEVAGDG
jgi:glycosyltransferase involved in cell wall biosynthesis